MSVSKPGFITLSHGQRRPRQPSTPVQIEAGRHVANVSFSLPPGGVITGRVADEDGAPLPLIQVVVLRYVYQQGQRQLVPAGNDGSDDRGEYRVFGLKPGDYYVSAVVSQRRFAVMAFGTRGGAGSRFGGADAATEETEFGYALTYYPGVTGLAQATAVNVGLSTESRGVDFSVQFVRTARLSGTLFGADGTPPRGAQVMLVPDEGVVFRDRCSAPAPNRIGSSSSTTCHPVDTPFGPYRAAGAAAPARLAPASSLRASPSSSMDSTSPT